MPRHLPFHDTHFSDTHQPLSQRRIRMSKLRESKTSKRRAETVRRLLDAGRHVIAEFGIAGASVQLITAEAGFTRGAFYSNFSDMDHFVQAIAQREWEMSLEIMRNRLSETSPDGSPSSTGKEAISYDFDATSIASSLRDATQGLLGSEALTYEKSSHKSPLTQNNEEDSAESPSGIEGITLLATALIAAIPRDRETFLLWSALSSFLVRNPEESDALLSSFRHFRDGMAQFFADALDSYGLESDLSSTDFIDLIIAVGMRSTRNALIPLGEDNDELLDRVLPKVLPLLRAKEE